MLYGVYPTLRSHLVQPVLLLSEASTYGTPSFQDNLTYRFILAIHSLYH
jgi:hypothetical protein